MEIVWGWAFWVAMSLPFDRLRANVNEDFSGLDL
jgi:hypothetical protein